MPRVVGKARRDVRMMVLHAEVAKLTLVRDLGAVIFGMQVVSNTLGLEAIQSRHFTQGLIIPFARAQGLEISQM